MMKLLHGYCGVENIPWMPVFHIRHFATFHGHQGCANALAWISKGSLLLSGSIRHKRMASLTSFVLCFVIQMYPTHGICHTHRWMYGIIQVGSRYNIDSGHSVNIFCVKCNDMLASGARDSELINVCGNAIYIKVLRKLNIG